MGPKFSAPLNRQKMPCHTDASQDAIFSFIFVFCFFFGKMTFSFFFFFFFFFFFLEKCDEIGKNRGYLALGMGPKFPKFSAPLNRQKMPCHTDASQDVILHIKTVVSLCYIQFLSLTETVQQTLCIRLCRYTGADPGYLWYVRRSVMVTSRDIHITINVLKFRTPKWIKWRIQTVQTQIRLLLKEHSNQRLHCLPFHKVF